MLVLVGPCPFLCCFAVLLGGETQIWLGDLRVVFLAVVLVVWFVSHDDLPEIFGPHVSCTLLLFTAYAIVRTVPSANRPNRRKKKDNLPDETRACWIGDGIFEAFPGQRTRSKNNTKNKHKQKQPTQNTKKQTTTKQ